MNEMNNYELLKTFTMEELAKFHIYHINGLFIGLSKEIRYTPDDVYNDNIDWLIEMNNKKENII